MRSRLCSRSASDVNLANYSSRVFWGCQCELRQDPALQHQACMVCIRQALLSNLNHPVTGGQRCFCSTNFQKRKTRFLIDRIMYPGRLFVSISSHLQASMMPQSARQIKSPTYHWHPMYTELSWRWCYDHHMIRDVSLLSMLSRKLAAGHRPGFDLMEE